MYEVDIISNIYMDEEGIPMLVTMSQYKNGDQYSNNGSLSIHIQLVIHNGGIMGG